MTSNSWDISAHCKRLCKSKSMLCDTTVVLDGLSTNRIELLETSFDFASGLDPVPALDRVSSVRVSSIRCVLPSA